MHEGGEKYQDALYEFQELGEKYSMSLMLLNSMAVCQMQMGKWREAEELLAGILEFDAADARLRADALKLKATWDDLQLQAYDAFVRGEASRADTARAAADGAALSLVHLKHEASQESTD